MSQTPQERVEKCCHVVGAIVPPAAAQLHKDHLQMALEGQS
jgi:hypothetical protein